MILVRAISNWWMDPDANEYPQAQAELLREEGDKIETEPLVSLDLAASIDETATKRGADMIACATHGRGPLGTLVKGGIAWRMVAHSPAPVLLRHMESTDGR